MKLCQKMAIERAIDFFFTKMGGGGLGAGPILFSWGGDGQKKGKFLFTDTKP